MRRVALVFFTLLLITTIVGCSPKGDPKETLETYYSYVTTADYNAAYALLSEADKQVTRKDDFVLYMELSEEVAKLNKVEVKQAEKNGDAMVFDVVENRHDAVENKDKDDTLKRAVVVENGEWRVKVEGKYSELIADQQAKIGSMFLNGNGGKEANPRKAGTWFEDALESDPSYYRAYYGLAASYMKIGLLEEAIEAATEYVKATSDNKEKSNGMNILGICYDGIGDKAKAKESFQKAVELDPENKFAKNNLDRL